MPSLEAQRRVLDEVAANATVAPVTRLVDGWLAKAAPGLPFRRANAVLPTRRAAATGQVGSTLDELERWYAELGQRVLIQVPMPDGSPLDATLAARGYAVEAPVDVLVGDTPAVGRRPLGGPTTTVRSEPVETIVQAGLDEAWARRYGEVHGDDDVGRARVEAYGRMLAGFGPAAVGVAVVDGDDVLGVGFGVCERGLLGIFGMGTAAGARRRGVATAVLGALAGAAADRGVGRCYLQVEVDNDAAHALYARAGFRRSHGYHYRVSAAAGEAGP